MTSSSERVKRYRERQAQMGLVNVSLYVSPALLEAVKQYGDAWETSVPESLVSLIFSGLRTEGYLEAPPWFAERMRERFMKQG
jgi:hypothetical protein